MPLKLKKITVFIYIFIMLSLCAYPFINDSRSMLILLTQIFIFAIFAMSYDLLIGYTGIVSFGHCMFFGIGAYSVAIMLEANETTMSIFFLGILIGLILTGIVSYIIGILSLRLQSHFYAMLTLGFAELFFIIAEKWRSVTHGGDGFTFRVPDFLRDRFTFYFFALISLVLIFIFLQLFTRSSTGKILKAISQNEQRVEALGFKVLNYKIIASVISGVIASYSGALYVLTLRFVDPNVFSIDITLNAILMTMIGGVGTLIGPIIGSGVVEFAQHYLSELASQYPIFERWTLFLGILYIVVVLVFPKGIVGSLKSFQFKAGENHYKENVKEIV